LKEYPNTKTKKSLKKIWRIEKFSLSLYHQTIKTMKKQILAGWDLTQVEDEMEAQMYWEDFIQEVKTMMKKMRTTKFFCYGLSLTWRNVAGYTEFETNNAETLVRKLAPNSDYTMVFHPTENKGIIEVVITHHDKPTGETMYLMSQSMEKKQGIKQKHF
jgi:hypothetical protein